MGRRFGSHRARTLSNDRVDHHRRDELSGQLSYDESTIRYVYVCLLLIVSLSQGAVTINIRRRKDGQLIQSVTTNIVEVFRDIFEIDHSKKSVVKSVATIENNNSTVKMLSKGSCSFQFAMKQRIDLSEQPLPIDKEKMMID